ncbi:hypothetical protein F4703DRAFT_1827082 [Phycomyces blakesleeanus]
MEPIDTSPIDSPRPQSKRWVKRPTSTKPRKVDLELQRIKSLAVVSVLNKAFHQEGQESPSPPPIARQQSSSSIDKMEFRMLRSQSSTTSLRLEDPPRSRPRSQTLNFTRKLKQEELDRIEADLLEMFAIVLREAEAHAMCKSSNKKDQPPPSSPSSPLSSISTISTAENELAERYRVLENLYSASTERLEIASKQQASQERQQVQRDQTTQRTLTACLEQKELESVKVRTLSELVLKQEQLIRQLESNLDTMRLENAQLQLVAGEDGLRRLEEARASMAELALGVDGLSLATQDHTDQLANLQAALGTSQERTECDLKRSEILSQECGAQRHDLDDKLISLMRQLADRDQLIKNYQTRAFIENSNSWPPRRNSAPHFVRAQKREQDRRISLVPTEKEDLEDDDGCTIQTEQSSYSSISLSGSGIPRPPDGPIQQGRRRSSAQDNNRRSYIARWAGGGSVNGSMIPPPAPPPTDPLPPIPAETITVSRSVLPRPVSVDNYARDEPIDTYREFTEQLQARFGISKEIDELRVWQSSDLEALQKQVSSRWKDDPESRINDPRRHSTMTISSKESPAFWRGMKKKLGV